MSDMTLPQIRSAKTAMQQKIEKAASEAIRAFQEETGLCVTDVLVQLVSIERTDQPTFTVVDSVRCEVDAQL